MPDITLNIRCVCCESHLEETGTVKDATDCTIEEIEPQKEFNNDEEVEEEGNISCCCFRVKRHAKKKKKD